MDETYLDEVIRLMEAGEYGYAGACREAWPSLRLHAEIKAIETQRQNRTPAQTATPRRAP